MPNYNEMSLLKDQLQQTSVNPSFLELIHFVYLKIMTSLANLLRGVQIFLKPPSITWPDHSFKVIVFLPYKLPIIVMSESSSPVTFSFSTWIQTFSHSAISPTPSTPTQPHISTLPADWLMSSLFAFIWLMLIPLRKKQGLNMFIINFSMSNVTQWWVSKNISNQSCNYITTKKWSSKYWIKLLPESVHKPSHWNIETMTSSKCPCLIAVRQISP